MKTFDSRPLSDLLTEDPVELKCPCGKPLSLARLKNGDLAMGHFETACSPIITCTDGTKLLAKLSDLLRAGNFTTEFAKT